MVRAPVSGTCSLRSHQGLSRRPSPPLVPLPVSSGCRPHSIHRSVPLQKTICATHALRQKKMCAVIAWKTHCQHVFLNSHSGKVPPCLSSSLPLSFLTTNLPKLYFIPSLLYMCFTTSALLRTMASCYLLPSVWAHMERAWGQLYLVLETLHWSKLSAHKACLIWMKTRTKPLLGIKSEFSRFTKWPNLGEISEK